MNIGKWSFNDIVKAVFDRIKIRFIAGGFFTAMVISILSGYLANFLLNKAVNYTWIKALDIVTIVAVVAIVIWTIIGATILTKPAGKAKAKGLSDQIKKIFWKTIGVIVLYLLFVIGLAVVAAVIGQVIRIPYVGLYLMALLAVPAFVAFAFIAVYLAITGKLLVIATVEQSTKSALTITKNLISMTLQNPKKLMLNGVLAIFAVLPLTVACTIVFLLAYFMYIFFGWQICGLGAVLGLYLQSGVGIVYFILSISTSFVLSYLIAHVTAMAIALGYSIYLDAE